jgi:hypothetical protein
MSREVQRTDDGRNLVVDGRRRHTADPELPDDVRTRLLHHLGVARAAVKKAKDSGDADTLATARARVQLAKTGLGERAPAGERTSLPPPLASSRRVPAGRPPLIGQGAAR